MPDAPVESLEPTITCRRQLLPWLLPFVLAGPGSSAPSAVPPLTSLIPGLSGVPELVFDSNIPRDVEIARKVIEAALTALGLPYQWGGGALDGPTMGDGTGGATAGYDLLRVGALRGISGNGKGIASDLANPVHCWHSIAWDSAQPGDLRESCCDLPRWGPHDRSTAGQGSSCRSAPSARTWCRSGSSEPTAMSSEDEAHEMVDATGTTSTTAGIARQRAPREGSRCSSGRAHPVVNELFAARKYLRSSETVSHSCNGELENRVGPSDLARERYRGLGYLSPMWWTLTSSTIRMPSRPAYRVYMKISSRRRAGGSSVTDECWWTSSPKHEWNVSPVCTDWASRSIRSLFVSGLGPLREARFG